MWLTERNIG
jgi:hypothetical protein